MNDQKQVVSLHEFTPKPFSRRRFLSVAALAAASPAVLLTSGCGGGGSQSGGPSLSSGAYLFSSSIGSVGYDARTDGAGDSVVPLAALDSINGMSAILYGTGDLTQESATVLQSIVIPNGASLGVRLLHDTGFVPVQAIDQKTGNSLVFTPTSTGMTITAYGPQGQAGKEVLLAIGATSVVCTSQDGTVLATVPLPNQGPLMKRTVPSGGQTIVGQNTQTLLYTLSAVLALESIALAFGAAAAVPPLAFVLGVGAVLAWFIAPAVAAIVNALVEMAMSTLDKLDEPFSDNSYQYWQYTLGLGPAYSSSPLQSIAGFYYGRTTDGNDYIAGVGVNPATPPGGIYGYYEVLYGSGIGEEPIYNASWDGSEYSFSGLYGGGSVTIRGEHAVGQIDGYPVSLVLSGAPSGPVPLG